MGRPCSLKTDDNIIKINEIVRKNQWLRIRMIAEVFINDKETVRPKLWENNFWIWYQDNVPAYNALSVKRFLAKN